MGLLIRLAAPAPAGADAARVYYAVGRSLTASDFAQQSRYVDARLLGLTPAQTGAISGLGITPARYDSPDGTTGLASLVIGTGSGLGADGRLVRLTTPLILAWQDLMQAIGPGAPIADGVYLLLLRTATFDGLEGPPPDPCARASSDPLLDIRQDSFVEAWLSTPLAPLPATASTAGLALAINTLVGGLTQDGLAAAVGNGVPLALTMVRGGKLVLLSQAAGRLPATPDSLGAMLMAQVREAFAMALAEAGANPSSAAWQSAISGRFRYLPGAGELPLALLLTPAAASAACPFFPPGIAVYLQAIRASQAAHLLQSALGRPTIDLAANTAEAVTLSLAVPDAAWTPDLLAMPRADPVLAGDLHFAYARARVAQVAVREDWIALYGGLAAVPAAFAQEMAFLIGADAAAQNLAFLFANGALSAQDLLAAADTATTPAAFLPVVTGWLQGVAAAATAAGPASGAAAAAAITAAAPSASAAALATALNTALAAWPTAATAATSAAAAGGTTLSIATAAAVAAAIAALGASPTPAATAGATAAGTAAAVAAAATVASGAAATAIAPAALAAATLPAALPAAPPAPPNAADAAHLLANLGYQIIDPEPVQADPSVTPAAPAASDSVLAPLLAYLPANSAFADWSAAISDAAANPALLQPLIDAGLFDAGADASAQAAAITALLALPTAADPANDDTQPGMLLSLATQQLYYAVLGRVTRAQEYLLDAHSRLVALQRQHLDMMSTYVSALAGGVPSDGSGLSFTRIIPFYKLAATMAEDVQQQQQQQVPAVRLQRTVLPAAANPAPQIVPSLVQTVPANATILSSPVISDVGSLFGRQTDIAKTVASETSALIQSPPLQYQPVQVGLASYVTSGATLFQSAQTGLAGLRGLMNAGPIRLVPTTPNISLSSSDEPANYSAIVETTRNLLGDINQVENNAIRIEAGYLLLRDRAATMQGTLTQATAAVAAARDTLRAAQVNAAQAAGDYAAAQRLVQEETARVLAAVAARNAAIAAATGLFMVRQLQTATPGAPPVTISLAADSPQDLAPGCTADHPGPPAALTPFLDLLLEVPLQNWRPLAGGWTDLPDSAGLSRLSLLRTARLAGWAPSATVGGGAAAASLSSLASTTRAVFDPVLRAGFTVTASLAASQQAAFAVFSPPDLITLPTNTLRTNAEALRTRLESAAGCLFQTLTALPPSARFAWATLAQAGSLPALAFAQWPLPQGMGDSGTTTLRQLAALVQWMAAQLAGGSSAAAQTALGNLVTAAVIAAAYGDPDEAVTGTVASSGGVPQPGVPIRVVLNRPPPIGTVLNLFDGNRTLVGSLRVLDHDPFGTTATVVTSFAATAANSAWTVASPGGRSPWLAS